MRYILQTPSSRALGAESTHTSWLYVATTLAWPRLVAMAASRATELVTCSASPLDSTTVLIATSTPRHCPAHAAAPLSTSRGAPVWSRNAAAELCPRRDHTRVPAVATCMHAAARNPAGAWPQTRPP